MLKVTIEYLPFGKKKDAKVIEEFTVTNDGKHRDRPAYGNYVIDAKSSFFSKVIHFIIKDFPRTRSVYGLIHEVAKKLEPTYKRRREEAELYELTEKLRKLQEHDDERLESDL